MESLSIFPDLPIVNVRNREHAEWPMEGRLWWQAPDQRCSKLDPYDAVAGSINSYDLGTSSIDIMFHDERTRTLFSKPRPYFTSSQLAMNDGLGIHYAHADPQPSHYLHCGDRPESPDDSTQEGSYCGDGPRPSFESVHTALHQGVDDQSLFPYSDYTPFPPYTAAQTGIAPSDVQRFQDESEESLELCPVLADEGEYDPVEVGVPYSETAYGRDDANILDGAQGSTDGNHNQPVQAISNSPDSEWVNPAPGLKRNKRSQRVGSGPAARTAQKGNVKGPTAVRTSTKKSSPKVTKHYRKHSASSVGKGGGGRSPRKYHPYPCPFAQYKCNATFASKNEWKRHVSTQHVQLGVWRCQLCRSGPEGDFNDFNRKDLFIQHIRRMHNQPKNRTTGFRSNRKETTSDDKEMDALQKKCYCPIRSAPSRSGCLFCPKTFEGERSWDERMDHVASHLEQKPKDEPDTVNTEVWRVDEALRDWLIEEDLVERDGEGGWVLRSVTARLPAFRT